MWQDTTYEAAFQIKSIHSEGCDEKKLRPIHILKNNLMRILLMQADVGSMTVCFTNVSLFFQL